MSSENKGVSFPERIEAAIGNVTVLIENNTDKPPQEPEPKQEGERIEK